MTRGCVLLLAFLPVSWVFSASPDPRSLEIPSSETLRARELVRLLGSESYPERERAQRTLATMGRLAKPALAEAARTHSDPEVLRRVLRVLPHANDADMQARVDVFLADVEGKYEHDFPGWKPYREIAGSDAPARALFAEMVRDRANANLLAALEGPADELVQRFRERRQNVWNAKYPRTPDAVRHEPKLSDLAALLLVDAIGTMPSQANGVSVASFFASTTFLSGGLQGTQGEVVKKLLNRWVVSRDDANFLYQALTVANRFDLSGATLCAAKLLSTAKAPPYTRAPAITTLARALARDQLPALEKCLDDEALCTRARPIGATGNEFHDVRVQDMALAAAIMVTGQKPEAYGFKDWTPPGSTASRFRYLNYYITADSRAAAFAKWDAWRKANPDRPTPVKP